MEKSLKEGGGWASSDPLNPPLLIQAQTLRHLSFRMTLHLSALITDNVRSGIRKSEGITTRPLNAKDISTESARVVIPDDLYWLIRAIITGEYDKEHRPQQCNKISMRDTF